MSKKLLTELFNYDFSLGTDTADLRTHFFSKTLSVSDLHKICSTVCAQQVTLGGHTIPAAMLIPGKEHDAPFAILAQLHGNEPAGLAGITLAMALAEMGQLEQDIVVAIGNPLAANQYFEHRLAHPHARQETRDAYRCGLSEDGILLPDMNRIPVDFRTRDAKDHHTKRAQELFAMGENICGIADIHSARGNMLCVTDYKHESELKGSPIRAVLTGLAEAISANASATVTVQTLKTILMPLPNIKYQVGIEAGRHEALDAPFNAATFTLSLLHTLGMTHVKPIFTEENNLFDGYAVQPRITYADLDYGNSLRADDHVYMATECHALSSVPARSDSVIVKHSDGTYAIQSVVDFTDKPAGTMEFAIFQYDEMEAIAKDHVVAVAIPSGTTFKTKSAFSGIFLSKSGALYDKDPSVGPWPVAAANIGNVKFCYPCNVSKITLAF